MSKRFAARAEEFIAKVQAASLDPGTEVVLVYDCVDASGQPLPHVRVHLEPTTTVDWPGDSVLARRFAAALNRDTVIGSINSLVANLPEGPILLPGKASDNEMPMEARVQDVSLEIVRPDGDPVSLAGRPDAPPLRDDGKGGLRVGKSRVLLELVVQAHQDGDSPDAILRRYPTLDPSDVYSVIAFYLRHRGDVEGYLARREQQARDVWERIDRHQATSAGSESNA
jgi:uncharacterized protein (DUF433 family)